MRGIYVPSLWVIMGFVLKYTMRCRPMEHMRTHETWYCCPISLVRCGNFKTDLVVVSQFAFSVSSI